MQSVAALVAQYRELKERESALKSEMDRLKADIQVQVERDGNWKDDEGYARMTHRSAYSSFDGKAVSNLMCAWLISEDAIMQSCGNMLKGAEKFVDAKSYLTIK